MDITGLTQVIGYIIYGVLALIALWGFFCVVMIWIRIGQQRFRSEAEQDEFLAAVEAPLEQRQFEQASSLCEGDSRVLPQLALLAIVNRRLGYAKARQLVLDRFQRDVLSDLEHRLSWVNTVIKSAPMVGLLGTVIGMMGAFAKLAADENTNPDVLAADISFALITTACGLAIAIPLVFCTTSINVKIRKLEESVAAGLTRFLEVYRAALGREG